MPSHVPRGEPSRKKDLVLERSEDLRLAIYHGHSQTKIEKAAEKYRDANIAFIKAKFHATKELEFQGKIGDYNLKKLEQERNEWIRKDVKDIIAAFNKNST